MSQGAPESLRNGEHSLDFTYYEQTTNRFWAPHLAESRVKSYLHLGYALHWMPPLQKFPYTKGWQIADVPDLAQLEEQYWHLAAECRSIDLNLGVRTGKWSTPAEGLGLLIVDVDLRLKAHTGECQAIVERLLGDVSKFPYVASGRAIGGHYHMSCPLDKLPSSAAIPVASKYDGDVKL